MIAAKMKSNKVESLSSVFMFIFLINSFTLTQNRLFILPRTWRLRKAILSSDGKHYYDNRFILICDHCFHLRMGSLGI